MIQQRRIHLQSRRSRLKILYNSWRISYYLYTMAGLGRKGELLKNASINPFSRAQQASSWSVFWRNGTSIWHSSNCICANCFKMPFGCFGKTRLRQNSSSLGCKSRTKIHTDYSTMPYVHALDSNEPEQNFIVLYWHHLPSSPGCIQWRRHCEGRIYCRLWGFHSHEKS